MSCNEQFLGAVFDSIQDGISVLDTDLTICRVNEVIRQWYSPNLPLEGKKCFACYHNHETRCDPCPAVRSIRSGRTEVDIVPGLPGRPEEWIELYTYPMKDPRSGKVTHVIEFVRDITQKAKVERGLRESERKMSTLLSNLPGMAYKCRNDPSRTMEFLSEGCTVCTGYDSKVFVHNAHKSFAEVIVPEDREYVAGRIQEAWKNHHPFELEYRITTAHGELKWVWERGIGVEDDGEGNGYVEGFICDITDRKSLEAQYLQAQKMEAVGKLAGGLAHDFNNMMQVISGHADLIAQAGDSSDMAREHAIHIQQTGHRAQSLVHQLLALSRNQILNQQEVDLNELLATFLPMIRPMLGESVQLEFSSGQVHGPVYIDPVQIEQVLLNLCINARDAMPDGGRLTIQTGGRFIQEHQNGGGVPLAAGWYAVISVTDTGCGMDQPTLDHIFEPFFTTKQAGEGSGLGLSTVFGIVRQHQGRMDVYSETGTGSRFEIILPLAGEPRIPEQPQDMASSTAESPAQCTVLVAEDSETVRELVCTALGQAGFGVLTAEDGEQAVQCFVRHADLIDVVLLDLNMPKCNGLQARQKMKTVNPEVKTILCTGYIPRNQAIPCEPGLEVIQKPYQREDLIKKIKEMLYC